MPVDNNIYNRAGDIWWDEGEIFHTLRTSLNPGRFGYFRRVLLAEMGINPRGKKALDVGCGGGLLAEEFAQLGCQVTGLDPSIPSLLAAMRHARQSGLAVNYVSGTGEQIPFDDATFDIVYCCDVLEHVDDPAPVIAEIARVLRKDGVFFFDTINRTLSSKIVVIKLFQEWGFSRIMPPHLHDWNMFIRPVELRGLMDQHGLELKGLQGLRPGAHPLVLLGMLIQYKSGRASLAELSSRARFQPGTNTSISYMGYAMPR